MRGQRRKDNRMPQRNKSTTGSCIKAQITMCGGKRQAGIMMRKSLYNDPGANMRFSSLIQNSTEIPV